MAPPHPDDRSLLDRLNALKPTSVSLDKPANTATAAAAVPGSESPPGASREDALAARLRILRSRQGSSNHDGTGTIPPPAAEPTSSGGRPAKGKPAGEASPLSRPGPMNASAKLDSYQFFSSEADDEEALDELLESLGDAHFDLAEGEDAGTKPDSDPSGDAKKVADFLNSLQQGSENPLPKGDSAASADDDDDSDGEHMTRAVETILSQLGDEINSLPPPAPAAETATGPNPEADELSLSLPAVPSQLQDPVPDPKPEDDFERDISARLASLRGFGTPDALGLPSAPTFRPQDRRASDLGQGLLRSTKYTDEDQKTWCVACLDDATIRCVGCDNDVFCARCWKEMHLGPSAGAGLGA
ncbi:42d060d9-d346-489d-a7de-47a94c2079a4 [Thermothielavioides terrestris]|uniref:42d060d9-d346-489d-a7de-47a94c2079a4 n=1 Tax=Thermothielavioides terrestris TaxID=2587410 RepID=A0A3S4B0A5_9PEZI|nr:42d060d9-d346-489d-a7de-47a94c2079a4 [Thermothielavioides terrestris]